MKTHLLKTWPSFFWSIRDGKKTFEIRKNDRDFKDGDRLFLQEFDPADEKYTGRSIVVNVTYLMRGQEFGIMPGFVLMGIKVIDTKLN